MPNRPLTLSLVTLFCLAGALACANPADNVPPAQVTEAAGAPAAAADPAPEGGRVFKVGGGSTVGFIGSKITGSHDGGFHGLDGEIHLVDGDPAKSTVRLNIDTTTLWADDERLTGHLKSPDFFDVEQFPTASFTSTAIVPAGDGYLVTGDLDLHGVTKSISFPAQIEANPDRVTARAEFSILRFDFGIVYPGKPDDLIRDEVVVKFDLVATPAG
jgi:polyisoprenoid-binding protein YceI